MYNNPYGVVNYKDADPWGRMLIFTMTLCSILWVISVINQTEAGGSDQVLLIDYGRFFRCLCMAYVFIC